ncbi:MAG: hypothetical protein COB67_04880 [SAR324 cluster bacterium]|uniref:Uncharacterized protein n=1 Tax=SAR324 cluster bacterium TaxID=2024889 RepID=A0A2A4T6C3_9DELT|nr:MAG: hypothetical protein COB67_04880 [SAR324 cluster bacterium]
MVPTKEEVELKIGKLAAWYDTAARPLKWIRQVQDFKKDIKKSMDYLPSEVKSRLKEKKKALELYMLEKRLIEIEDLIRKEKQKGK